MFPCVSIVRKKYGKQAVCGAGFWQARLALGCLKSGGHSATPGFVPPRCGSAVLKRDSVKTAVFRIPNGGHFSCHLQEPTVEEISLRTGRFLGSVFGSFLGSFLYFWCLVAGFQALVAKKRFFFFGLLVPGCRWFSSASSKNRVFF